MIDTTPRIVRERSLSIYAYPATFPCIGRDGYSLATDLGLVRSESGVVLPKQRRAYNNLPTVINAPFVVNSTQFLEWSWWVNDNVGRWVNFPLAHPFMIQGILIETVPARIVNGSMGKSYMPFGNIAITLQLQLSPSVFAESALP